MMDFAEESNSPTGVYDLAMDDQNILPDDLIITGLVTKKTLGGSVYLTLENAFIEDIGFIDLELRLRKSACFSCSNGYADINLEVRTPQATISLNDNFALIQRTWNYALRRYIPSRISMTDADISVAISADTERRITIRGETDIRLRLPYFNDQYLPNVESIAISGKFSQPGEDLSYFAGRLTYTNNNFFSGFVNDPVEFAKKHAERFSVSASFDARLRVPNEDDYSSPQYRNVGISIGMSTSTSSRQAERRWVKIDYEGEGFFFEYSKEESNNYRFANKAGAIMEVIMDENNENLLDGFINSNGKSIATIESSELGPIIRYADGTIESF